MKISRIRWKKEFEIGVEELDEDHKVLFEILDKIFETYTSKDVNNYKHVSKETIKYLKNYTIEHFAREEVYMRKNRYHDLPMHQKLHKNIKEITLPELEKDLIANDYSEESVLRLVGALSGWLSGHILIEDRAITGLSKSRFADVTHVDKMAFLDSLFTKLVRKMFDTQPNLLYEHYNGEFINNPYLIEIKFTDQNGKVYPTVIVSEKQMALFMTSCMLGINVDSMGRKDSVNAFIEFTTLCLKRVLEIIYPKTEFTPGAKRKLFEDDFIQSFSEKRPIYSPVWRCEQGLLGFCIYE